MKNKILESAQNHGDWAFLQGYEAAKRGIDKNDLGKLSKMPEAEKRTQAFVEISNCLKKESVNDSGN